MALYTDYERGRRNHKLWLIPILIVILVVFLANLGRLRSRKSREPAAATPDQPVASAVAPEPPPLAADSGQAFVDQAVALEAKGDLPGAREKCYAVLDASRDKAARAAAEDMLSRINIRLVFSPSPMPEKVDYVIEQGDTLGGLAKKFGTTQELIQKSNQVIGHIIRVGSRLRILSGTFSMTISKKRNDLVLKLNGLFFKRYRVGTGEHSTTPEGTFHITDRMPQPTWWRPDGKAVPYGSTNNVLGTHWLSLDIPRYGLHGTWEPDTIGKQKSAGCIRLLNADIEELYTLVPSGTEVVIGE
ncbi:MAG: L,D-transpeptidase family protein [Kiritimatiellae bacterium]|nr:L,D-transpeptidase family protein [Kiritimatiellia bacterium]